MNDKHIYFKYEIENDIYQVTIAFDNQLFYWLREEWRAVAMSWPSECEDVHITGEYGNDETGVVWTEEELVITISGYEWDNDSDFSYRYVFAAPRNTPQEKIMEIPEMLRRLLEKWQKSDSAYEEYI